MTDLYTPSGELKRMVSFDYETFMTTDNLKAPRAVVCSFATVGTFPPYVGVALGSHLDEIVHRKLSDGEREYSVALVDPHTSVRLLHLLLRDPNVLLVNQTISYDFGIMLNHAYLMELMGDLPEGTHAELHGLLLRAYDLDGTGLHTSGSRIVDTMVREILLKNAAGRGLYGTALNDLVKSYLHLDRSADKKGAPCVKCNATGKIVKLTGKHTKATYKKIPCALCEAGNCPEPKCKGTQRVIDKAPQPKTKKVNCTRCLGKKYDTPWRKKYHLLDGVPFANWPDKALEYVLNDATDALRVAIEQGGVFGDVDATSCGEIYVNAHGAVRDEAFQGRAAWSLRMAQLNGPRSYEPAIESWARVMEELVQEGLKKGQEMGFVRSNGKVNQKVQQQLMTDAYERQGLAVPLTKTGKVACNKKAFAGCDDKDLKAWHATGEGRLAKSKFIPAANRAVRAALGSKPGFFVSTGRTSWSDPAMHQPPRKQGFRECWRPRDGNVFIASDWDQAEMGTLAQILVILFGSSAMADSINAGKDLHLVLAVFLYRIWHGEIEYDEIKRRYDEGDELIAELRQFAKAGNFGFPGGLVAKTFVGYAEGYGAVITLAQAETIREAWLEAFPEMRDYLAHFKRLSFDGFTYTSWVSGMLRGDVYYTNGCNHGFQALVAHALKLAMWWVTREMYVEDFGGDEEVTWDYPHSPGDAEEPREQDVSIPSVKGRSPLYGYRMWLSVHDEILLEGPEEGSHAAAMRLQQLMVWALQSCTPDVKVGAQPTIMRVWSKKAKQVWEDGELKPWAPKDWNRLVKAYSAA